MAEPVSSIVTLATVGLAIIKTTAQFIDEVKTINTALARLKSTLADFESRIKIVKSTCARVPPRDDDASGYVMKTLKRCNRHLKRIQDVVQHLLDHESQTIFQQVALTIMSRRSNREIESAISDLKNLMEQVNLGLNCWNM
jgi:ubiquinone biosynthesis protein UbiJ